MFTMQATVFASRVYVAINTVGRSRAPSCDEYGRIPVWPYCLVAEREDVDPEYQLVEAHALYAFDA